MNVTNIDNLQKMFGEIFESELSQELFNILLMTDRFNCFTCKSKLWLNCQKQKT